jgi:peroxiredoxin
VKGIFCLALLLPAVAVGAVVGDRAPEFKLKDLTGRTRSLGELRQEHALLLDFSSVFCVSCQETLRGVEALRRDADRRGLRVAVVNVDGPRATQAVRSVAKGVGVGFPVLLDSNGIAAKDYGIEQIPSLVLIDKGGVIRAVHRGPVTRWELIRMLQLVPGRSEGGE